MALETKNGSQKISTNYFMNKGGCQSNEQLEFQEKLWALLDPLSFLMQKNDFMNYGIFAEDGLELEQASAQRVTFCKQNRHQKDSGFQVATHICYDDKVSLCSVCVKDHEAA